MSFNARRATSGPVFDSYTEIFTERAEAYHAAMTRSPHARAPEFEAVVEPLAGLAPGLLCNLPSAGGYLADFLPPNMQYLGVEPVEDFARAAGAGLTSVVAPITDVPLTNGSVDYLVSLAGLHHEPDLLPVFCEMRRLVRRGGRLVLADVEVGTAPARFLNGFVARHNPLGHDGRFLDQAAAQLLETAGLRVLDDQMLEVPWQFRDLEEAGGFCGELFGISGVSAAGITDALADEIGFDGVNGRLELRWTLRRIVCEPA